MRFVFVFLAIAIIIGAAAFFFLRPQQQSTPSQELSEVTLALDWTPNTNHTGIYVAKAKGWYEEAGIKLTILPYSSTVSSDVLVAAGKADVGISSTEGVLGSHALGQPLVSLAAILQHNTSSLAVLVSSGIERPADLSGKIYGGFGTPSEEAIVSAIVAQDGGDEPVENIVLDTAALEALKAERIDAMWIFEGWDGVVAKRDDVNLRTFPLIEHGIPDYYTPVIVTSPETLSEKQVVLRRFMTATARGYEFARENPKEAAQLLIDTAPAGTFPDTDLVFASQEYLSPRYADRGRAWGLQDPESWRAYPQFLLDSEAIVDAEGEPIQTLDFEKLYTNELFDAK